MQDLGHAQTKLGHVTQLVCVSQAWLPSHTTLPATTSPLICQTLPQAQTHHCIFLHLHHELGDQGRFCTPALIPQFSTQLHSLLHTVSSSLEQAGSAWGSFSKGLRHSKKQQLALPPKAWLFAGEQEDAQGTVTVCRTVPGGRPSARQLSLRPPARWPSPFSMVDDSRGSVQSLVLQGTPAMLQQLPAALAGSAAIGGSCQRPGATSKEGPQAEPFKY